MMSAHDQEIENLKAGVSCATLLEHRAWKLDKIQSTRHCWKYRCGAGGLVIVNHGGLGWWNPRSQAKGDHGKDSSGILTHRRRLAEPVRHAAAAACGLYTKPH